MNQPRIKLLYDGLCPICSREMRWLKWLDRRGRIEVEDISAPEFDPSQYGLTHDQVISSMHGVLPDGSIVRGVAAFRHAYSAVGLGWLLAWTKWPVLRTIAETAYRMFARIRPRLSRYAGPACTTDRCSGVINPPKAQSL